MNTVTSSLKTFVCIGSFSYCIRKKTIAETSRNEYRYIQSENIRLHRIIFILHQKKKLLLRLPGMNTVTSSLKTFVCIGSFSYCIRNKTIAETSRNEYRYIQSENIRLHRIIFILHQKKKLWLRLPGMNTVTSSLKTFVCIGSFSYCIRKKNYC